MIKFAALSNQEQKQGAKSSKNNARLLRTGVVLAGSLALISLPVRLRLQESQQRDAFLPDLEAQIASGSLQLPLLVATAVRETEAGDYTRASETLEKAAAGENDPALWLTWAATAAASGNRAKAEQILQRAVSNPATQGQAQGALDRVRSLPPDAPVERVAETISPGGVSSLRERYLKPVWTDGLVIWRDSFRKEESGFLAREQWAKDLPNDAQAQRLWGEALLKNRRLPEAEAAAQRAVELAPDSPKSLLLLGDVRLKGGAPAKAALSYIAALKRKPNWFPALMGMGEASTKAKILRIAVEAYKRATEQAPSNADAWIGLGIAYYNQLINRTGSLEAFQKAVSLAPTRTDFYKEYSNALRAKSLYPEAEALLRKRLTAAPDDAQAHYLLATLLQIASPSAAREAEAEQELRTSLKLEPTAITVKTRLGRLLLDHGNAAEAIPLLQSSIRADVYDLIATKALARAYRKVGKTQEADRADQSAGELSAYLEKVQTLENTIQSNPTDEKAHEKLARVFLTGGETEKAKRHQDMAYLLRTHRAEAIKGIQALDKGTSVTSPIH